MKSRYKQKMFCTNADVERAVKQECDAVIDRVYENVKQDVAAQIMAVCLTELQKEFGFGENNFIRASTGCFALWLLTGFSGANLRP